MYINLKKFICKYTNYISIIQYQGVKIECPETVVFLYIKKVKLQHKFGNLFAKLFTTLSHQKQCNPYHVKQRANI